MILARLIRQPGTEAGGTPGVLTVLGRSWFTIERPWLDNASGISCFPTGTYRVAQTWSPRFKRPMYQVLAVPERTGVRIHSANLARQLEGCIALGEKRGTIDGLPAVLVSKPAIRDFEALLAGRNFMLEVTQC